MSDSITFHFPELPVSVNKLYTVAHGRKILSKQGKAYRNDFITSGGGISKTRLMAFEADLEQEYQIHIWCLFPYEELYTATYGFRKNTKSPFKDIDVDNMAKIVIDCVAALVGIRDRNNFTVCLHKREATEPGLIALLEPLDLEEDPYPIPS